VSIFDSLFGNNSTTSETRSAVTGPATTAAQTLFNTANTVGQQGYQSYPGERVAGLTPDQYAATAATRNIGDENRNLYTQLRNTVLGGINARQPGQGTMNAGAANSNDLATGGLEAIRRLAVQFPDANIEDYMNPYTQQVLDPAIRDLTREAEKNRQAIIGRSAMTGSFGGSRNALAQSQAQQDTQEAIGDLSANERARAFTAATQQWRADQSAIPGLFASGQNLVNNAQGATVNADNFRRLGYQDVQNLLGSNQGRLATEVNPLLTVGGLDQGVNQARADAGYQDFTNSQNWGLRQIDALTRAFGAGTGATGQTTTSTVTPPAPNAIGQVVGSLGGLAGSVGAIAPAVSWLGNQASSWFSPSGGFTNTVADVTNSAGQALYGPGFKRGGLVHLPAA